MVSCRLSSQGPIACRESSPSLFWASWCSVRESRGPSTALHIATTCTIMGRMIFPISAPVFLASRFAGRAATARPNWSTHIQGRPGPASRSSFIQGTGSGAFPEFLIDESRAAQSEGLTPLASAALNEKSLSRKGIGKLGCTARTERCVIASKRTRAKSRGPMTVRHCPEFTCL
jgi:hypothetical protein